MVSFVLTLGSARPAKQPCDESRHPSVRKPEHGALTVPPNNKQLESGRDEPDKRAETSCEGRLRGIDRVVCGQSSVMTRPVSSREQDWIILILSLVCAAQKVGRLNPKSWRPSLLHSTRTRKPLPPPARVQSAMWPRRLPAQTPLVKQPWTAQSGDLWRDNPGPQTTEARQHAAGVQLDTDKLLKPHRRSRPAVTAQWFWHRSFPSSSARHSPSAKGILTLLLQLLETLVHLTLEAGPLGKLVLR